MRKARKKGIAILLVTALVLTGMAGTAYAALAQQTIDILSGVTVFIDGEELIPRDASGAIAEAFIHNGTTYLPARAISEALGKNVSWNPESGSALIASTGRDNPSMAIRVAPEEEHYIFELHEDVTRTHVYYNNRYGIEIAADLYHASDLDMSQQHPAIVVGPPFGGVKEQSPGVYANELAQRGFVVIAFDPAYHGYSGGEPRYTASTSLYAEDFSAAVDYLGVQSFVDREKIAAIGICGSGGFALSAASMDTRIKAVVTSVMYDIASGNSTGEARRQRLEQVNLQRWVDFENGTAEYWESYPEVPDAYEPLPEDYTTQQEWQNFYATTRGHHPNARANTTSTSGADMVTFPSLTFISEISPRPILFLVGENAHSRTFGDAAYERAGEPKEMFVAPGANHIDMYDRVDLIPFDKIESFLNEALS